MKKEFYLNKREKIILIIGIILVVLSELLLKSSILAIISAISTILVAIFQAKGKVTGEFIGIFDSILYAYLAYKNRLFGETAVYLLLLAPIYLYGVIKWLKHYDKKEFEVIRYNFKTKDIILIIMATIILFGFVYSILGYFNTESLFLSTISVFTSIYATWFVSIRSKWGMYIYLLDDIVMIIMWGIFAIRGDFSYFPIIIGQAVNVINDTYGSIIWTKKSRIIKNNELAK